MTSEPVAGDDRPMILLDELTKRYPGQKVPAVDKVSMSIPRGEIVVFVGPSGCGKTTTMRMINRLVEPTSGRIELAGEDVTHIDPDKLRRRIGYVIQQVGLFPHQTIRDNVGTVPRLLGWDKGRIDARVDELLTTVGMDPGEYRDRYPKELSGGQRQRIGVARAMSADPDVMLMDEPFGAIDPITRERLQNEFLRIQAEMRKTIIFVTHDIDEAIKMGDRIAILGDHSHIQQFATPEEILTNPANDFVDEFIGSGSALKRLRLSRVREISLAPDVPVGRVGDSVETMRRTLDATEWTALLVLDAVGRPKRWLTTRDLHGPRYVEGRSGLPVTAVVEPHATLHDALNEMLASNTGNAVVVDRTGKYLGIIDIDSVMVAVQEMQAERTAFFKAYPRTEVEVGA